LGNGEGEFPLVAVSSSSVKARCGSASPPIDLPRSMSVVRRRCHGLAGIAQIAGAVGCAQSQIFCGCRKRACCPSADSLLVFAASATSGLNLRLRRVGCRAVGGVPPGRQQSGPGAEYTDTANRPGRPRSSAPVCSSPTLPIHSDTSRAYWRVVSGQDRESRSLDVLPLS
jgi:hypothetical protein